MLFSFFPIAEAEYARELQVDIVPLLLQQDYRPDGWLGFIKGGKLYVDFSGKYSFDNKINELIKELGDRGRITAGKTQVIVIYQNSNTNGF